MPTPLKNSNFLLFGTETKRGGQTVLSTESMVQEEARSIIVVLNFVLKNNRLQG